MVQDVYIDILFLINFSMDYICFFICSKIMHRQLSTARILAASALGGIWSVISLFLPIGSWWEILLDCAVGFLLCAVVYLERGLSFASLFPSTLLFIGVSMMMGGCMTAMFNFLNKLELPLQIVSSDSISTYIFAILAALAGVISLASGQTASRGSAAKECRLKIKLCGIEFNFVGFVDSGNLVREPISGRAVIFVERGKIEKELSLDFLDAFLGGNIEADAPCKDMRLITLRTAAGESMAVAIRPESICAEFENRRGKTVSLRTDALISPIDIGSTVQGCTAIIPSEILKE